jgi:hypothetical protein
MAHPLYYHCMRYSNQPVTVFLKTGKTHYGVIQRVIDDGIHLMPLQVEQVRKCTTDPIKLEQADNRFAQSADAERVFVAPLFLPFAALAGLALGYAAGSTVPRPYPYYYGYGSGYGAPGYPAYGGYGPNYW